MKPKYVVGVKVFDDGLGGHRAVIILYNILTLSEETWLSHIYNSLALGVCQHFGQDLCLPDPQLLSGLVVKGFQHPDRGLWITHHLEARRVESPVPVPIVITMLTEPMGQVLVRGTPNIAGILGLTFNTIYTTCRSHRFIY
tara:strand:+ start:62 stop:484 length:423 start_codon:yes stop_codon:yes gene_type:complete